MEISEDDLDFGRTNRDIEDRVALIFENYTLDEILEMNDLSHEYAIYLLFMEGHINEPESYFP